MSSTNPTAYLSFFGLREQPFAPTTDPLYFYATRSHKECLFRLWSTIDERQGIAIVLGDSGTGKTMLLRKLLTGMAIAPEQYNTAVIGSALPSWNTQALLETIAAHFSLDPSPQTVAGCIEALNSHLLANRARINTLVIDDAQNINKRGQLELLRLMQNLETQQHKLLNVVLFAQLEWLEVLRAAPNFTQRANVVFTIEPMSKAETAELIDFRLRTASAPGSIFDEDAIEAIYAYAAGNPRLTVTLCRNALLIASRIENRTIGADLIAYTIEKAMGPALASRPKAETVETKEIAPTPPPPRQTEPQAATPVAMLDPLENSHEARATRLLRALKAKRDQEQTGAQSDPRP